MNIVVEHKAAGESGALVLAAPPLILLEHIARPEVRDDYTPSQWIIQTLMQVVQNDRLDVGLYDGAQLIALGSVSYPEDDIHHRDVSHVTATLIHPEYRGKGVYTTLFRELRKVPGARYITTTKRINSNEYRTRYRRIRWVE